MTTLDFQVAYLTGIAIKKIEVSPFVTLSEQKELLDLFDVKKRTNEQLQELRNTVVKTLADEKRKYRNENFTDWEKYDLLDNAMSKIVCVIDHEKYGRGMAV